MADKPDLPDVSPFVRALAGDAATPPDVRVLSGWLGGAAADGDVRLYLDRELSTFVDIPRDALLFVEDIADSHPAGAVNVWVRRDTPLKEGGSALSRAARFLYGQVQQDFAAGSGGGVGAPGNTQICLTFTPGCEVTGFTGDCGQTMQATACGGAQCCPTMVATCNPPSIGKPCDTCSGNCVSQQIPCIPRSEQPLQCDPMNQQQIGGSHTSFCPRTSFCPIKTAFCPIRTFANCGSAIDACPSSLGCTYACNWQFDQTALIQPQMQQQFAQQQVGGFHTSFCPRTSFCPVQTAFCPIRTFANCGSAIDACPSSLGCTYACNWQFDQTNVIQPQMQMQQQQQVGGFYTAFCPIKTAFCPIKTAFCPIRTIAGCGSAVDACPSSLGCTFACDWQFDLTNVIQPQMQQQFAQQQQFGGRGQDYLRTIWPSSVDGCPSSLGCTMACGQRFDRTIYERFVQPQYRQFAQQQQAGGFNTSFCPIQTALCPIKTSFCPIRTIAGCGSAVDACPSSLGCTFAGCGWGDIDQTIFQQQQFMRPMQQQPQQFLQATAFCPIQTRLCPIKTAICPIRTVAGCGSAIDACPSSLGCTFACDWGGFDQTILQQQQQFMQPMQQFGGAQEQAAIGITRICSITRNCPTIPRLQCSAVDACPTGRGCTAFTCPTNDCPSAVDACPSQRGCTVNCPTNPLVDCNSLVGCTIVGCRSEADACAGGADAFAQQQQVGGMNQFAQYVTRYQPQCFRTIADWLCPTRHYCITGSPCTCPGPISMSVNCTTMIC